MKKEKQYECKLRIVKDGQGFKVQKRILFVWCDAIVKRCLSYPGGEPQTIYFETIENAEAEMDRLYAKPEVIKKY